MISSSLFSRKAIIFIGLVCLQMPIVLHAQKGSGDYLKSNASISAKFQTGHVFATNSFVRGTNQELEPITSFQAYSIRFEKQLIGQYDWERSYQYPHYGFCLGLFNFFNPEEIGNPISLYAYFDAPFRRGARAIWSYEIGFGATANWKQFNPISNQYNIAIGAGETFIVDAGIKCDIPISGRSSIQPTVSLTHFSNGCLKRPNYGLNTIAPSIAIKHIIGNQDPWILGNKFHQTQKFEWLISTFGGIKNVIFDSLNIDIIEKYEGLNYPVAGLSTVINRYIGNRSKIGLGISTSYNSAWDAQMAVDKNELEISDSKFSDKLQLSIYPSYELIVGDFSMILEPSFYILRKTIPNPTPVFYQKIGLKYHFSEHYFAGITLRDYAFHVSDFVQWNVGYRTSW